MKIQEFEGRELLFEAKIPVPFGRLIREAKDFGILNEFEFPVIIKAQILSGGRGKSGGVKEASNVQEARSLITDMLRSEIKGEIINEVLVVEKLDIEQEHYLSYTFSTDTRTPILVFSNQGGIEVEGSDNIILLINALEGVTAKNVNDYMTKLDVKQDISEILVKLYDVFKKNDMILAEINPLVITSDGSILAADMKGILDDEALGRHNFHFPKRTGNRELTPIEKEAKKIDEEDYRGVAGKTFIELDGNIAVLASGGGASITAVDALYSYGAKPANYTEYSGNPSAEKVRKLTEVTLSKPGLKGCFVVGGKANFTRIDVTIKGFLDAIKKIRPKYPIVIRRDGPGKEEAFKMLEEAKKEGLDIHLYGYETPISKAAEIMAELAGNYEHTN